MEDFFQHRSMFQKLMVILPEILECFVGFLDRIFSNSKLCFQFLDVGSVWKRFLSILIASAVDYNGEPPFLVRFL